MATQTQPIAAGRPRETPDSFVPIVVPVPGGGHRLSSGRSVVPPAPRRRWRAALVLGVLGALSVAAFVLVSTAATRDLGSRPVRAFARAGATVVPAATTTRR